jgi:chromate transporter
LVFAPLSLVSFGGGASVFAEMQHQAVVVHGWVSQREFENLFAISRAAPGPGALLTTLIGWEAAGWAGALVVSLAFFLPSSILIYVVAHFWNRWRGSAWHAAVENGFAPIAAGLVLASGVSPMMRSAV